MATWHPAKRTVIISSVSTVSIIITSAHEPQTIGRALKAVLDQDSDQILEILVVSPDQETILAAKKAAKGHSKVKLLQDPGQGKPTALNLALSVAKGEILVLTDGDVFIGKNAIDHLLKPFSDFSVGGVCGQPIPTNRRDTMLGFWAHFLTQAAHRIRLEQTQKNNFVELSGYLLAARKGLITLIPPKTLADDSYISHQIAKKDFQSAYVPKAKVFVKYPTNLPDWFSQKKRSVFEYLGKKYTSGKSMRSPTKELFWGLRLATSFPKNLKESVWLALLFLARASLWLKILALNLKPFSRPNLWVPIKTTKD